MNAVDMTPIREFLPCATPRAWVDWALANPDILLVDHANCEKKAASTSKIRKPRREKKPGPMGATGKGCQGAKNRRSLKGHNEAMPKPPSVKMSRAP